MGVNGHWYIEIEKQGWWKGVNHRWSNRYVMSGGQPSASDAQTVISALHVIENTIMPACPSGGGVGFIAGKAYPEGKGTYFAEVAYNATEATGTATGFSGPSTPGYAQLTYGHPLETCVLVEVPINGLSSTGKPVSLRKYFRGIGIAPETGSTDGALVAQDKTAIAAATLPWTQGMGANNWVVIAPSGNQSSGPPAAANFLSNHQVPRGRKKKSGTTYSGGVLSDLLKAASDLKNLVGDAPVA